MLGNMETEKRKVFNETRRMTTQFQDLVASIRATICGVCIPWPKLVIVGHVEDVSFTPKAYYIYREIYGLYGLYFVTFLLPCRRASLSAQQTIVVVTHHANCIEPSPLFANRSFTYLTYALLAEAQFGYEGAWYTDAGY